MLTSRQIAKELISRKHQNPDTSITTSSYEMIDPVDADTSDHGPRRHFWGLNLKRRGIIHDVKGTENGRRVVSEPLPAGIRKMAVLRRFRFGRHDGDLEEEEGDLTISTETDVSLEQEGTEVVCSTSFPSSHHQTPPRSRSTNRSNDSGPSFISFASITPSTQGSPAPRPKQRERTLLSTPSPISTSPTTHLAPILNSPITTPTRGEAIRAITTEARFADTSMLTEGDSNELPSMADTSSSFGGILRARHGRVPHNTPVQNVRFLDSPRTEYLRRKAQERLQGPMDDRRTPEPLPRAQITQSSRWTRLGEILHLIENEDRLEADVKAPIEPSTPPSSRATRSSKHSAASSPISFARFDPPDPICSTPLPRYRFLPISSSSEQSRPGPTPSRVSDTSLSVEVSSTWSTRFADEDGIVEVCSALEALWEYGSSSEGEAREEVRIVDSQQKGTEYSGERRGSADLLPLKFKGYSRDVAEGELSIG